MFARCGGLDGVFLPREIREDLTWKEVDEDVVVGRERDVFASFAPPSTTRERKRRRGLGCRQREAPLESCRNSGTRAIEGAQSRASREAGMQRSHACDWLNQIQWCRLATFPTSGQIEIGNRDTLGIGIDDSPRLDARVSTPKPRRPSLDAQVSGPKSRRTRYTSDDGGCPGATSGSLMSPSRSPSSH